MTNDDIRELALDLADVFALHFSKPREECRRVALTLLKQRIALEEKPPPMEVERVWGPPTDEDD